MRSCCLLTSSFGMPFNPGGSVGRGETPAWRRWACGVGAGSSHATAAVPLCKPKMRATTGRKRIAAGLPDAGGHVGCGVQVWKAGEEEEWRRERE